MSALGGEGVVEAIDWIEFALWITPNWTYWSRPREACAAINCIVYINSGWWMVLEGPWHLQQVNHHTPWNSYATCDIGIELIN